MKHQPGMTIERGSGVGHLFPLKSVGCSRRWSQPRGTSLLSRLAPLQGISDGRRIKDKTRICPHKCGDNQCWGSFTDFPIEGSHRLAQLLFHLVGYHHMVTTRLEVVPRRCFASGLFLSALCSLCTLHRTLGCSCALKSIRRNYSLVLYFYM